jgi:hypothetical protein
VRIGMLLARDNVVHTALFEPLGNQLKHVSMIV